MLNILVDECVDYRVVNALRENSLKVISLREKKVQADNEVLELVMQSSYFLTEDKEFSEWVSSKSEGAFSVVFLDYGIKEFSEITGLLLKLLTYKSIVSEKIMYVSVAGIYSINKERK